MLSDACLNRKLLTAVSPLNYTIFQRLKNCPVIPLPYLRMVIPNSDLLQKENQMAETTWATVTETNGFTVAELLVQRLQAAKIPAQAIQESAGKAFGFSGGPLGTAYVKVPAQFLEEARLLLDVADAVEDDNIVVCPSCDSEIELDEAEWEQGWFSCPVCATRVSLDSLF